MHNSEFINHFDPVKHKGYLPVRVLPGTYINRFLDLEPDLQKDLEYAFGKEGEYITIIYQQKLTDIGDVDNDSIKIYENFNQFLWSICYTCFVIFEEVYRIPASEDRLTGEIDFSNYNVSKAIQLFNLSFTLFDQLNASEFFELPNPEKYKVTERYYIEQTNTIFSAAMVFTLSHEFGHKYFYHTEYESSDEESKKDEFIVDEFAYDKISPHFEKKENGYKLGVIMGLGALIFLDDTLKGGNRHPDPDHRLKKLIERMNLSETDPHWVMSSILFELWGIKNQRQMLDFGKYNNQRDIFYAILNNLDEHKVTQEF